MATDITTGFTYIKDIFVDSTFLNLDWIIGLFIVLVTLIIITRDIEKWKLLLFPIVLGWHIVGVHQNLIIFMFSSILFALALFDKEVVGNIISFLQDKKTEIQTKLKK